MMMSLDQFVFSLATAPYRELQRQRSWKHRTSSRIGARDASQFTGAGDDTITLNGMVAPDNDIGSIASIDELARMGDVGDAYVLVDGIGNVYGAYVIESLNETQTYHTQEGIPRKIEFNLTLKRVDDEALQQATGVTEEKGATQ
ncbi:TPA: phage tail protein [Burkholderia vietnamiensis]|uniref:phage tail protein n=1 Tax=Burkholderia vietnamiensis TaxID=60552 RepID=UPI001BA08780|nr:phage tail protein [Burkholderia vietnamiensis]MBR7908583.1 phage tail protein [Burkholderia vietnamiensis]HDR9048596.1 phage tail protein [Burkholderia vietnamiensis]HDR9231853.1 phage tail protein [Burkholderia vietnamiensis]HDR9272429.1 phage tail protein [Burkholderia vietnamiensis]